MAIALGSKITVITGGPGVGNTVIDQYSPILQAKKMDACCVPPPDVRLTPDGDDGTGNENH